MRIMIFNLLFGITLLMSCTENTANRADANLLPVVLPPDIVPTEVSISNLNCWIEKNRFFAVGICDNLSPNWQKIWLRMAPMDIDGKPLTVNGAPDAVFATFSDAVPPRGRTSFFAEWPVSAFSGTPDSCIVTAAGGVLMPPGPILINSGQNGVRMLMSEKVGDSTMSVEKAWMVNVLVDNPLEIQALHPRTELLLYGTDQRLWFSSVLNPEDSLQMQVVKAERDGPMAPLEKRRIAAYVYYENLPQALKDQKIGRVEFQPFEARPR